MVFSLDLKISMSFCSYVFYLITLLSFMFNISHALKLHNGNETDMQALLAIKEKITQDPHGIFTSWNNSVHFCSWEGVICGHPPQRVTQLHLTSLDLAGTLSPFIGNLTFLTSIKLELNNFHGKIPPQIGGFFRLQHLSLTNNSFSGEIPINLSRCLNLVKLGVGWNQLSGKIPFEFGSLQKLERLEVHNNNLTGSIPETLGNLSAIKSLSLSVNNLEGTIPSSCSQWKAWNVLLKVIKIGHKWCTEPHPKSLSNASNLVELDAYGEVDDMRFVNSLSRCRNLQVMDLSDCRFGDWEGNQLFGSIHSGIGNLVNLKSLRLHKNHFSGSIPEVVGNLRRLQLVDLSENKFSGSIPSSISNMTRLYSLHLENNELTGNIPLSFGDFRYLQDLDLSQNHLSGTIPDGFMSLSSLKTSLNLADNQLSGPLSVEIGGLNNLERLDISNNMLSGKIPSSIGRCVALASLVLSGNFFEGIIPSSISSLKGLEELDVSRNNLSGKIPTSLQLISLKKVNLSFNQLEGQLPTEGVFRNATAISVSGNRKLCGGIPELELPICPNAEPDGRDKSRSIKLMIPLLSGLVALVFIMSLVIIIRLRKARGDPSLTSSPVTYESLYRATNGFSSANLIGNGSFISVYKGVLDPGECMVAVKVINIEQQGATSKNFMAQCEALRNIRHQNLVKIYAACSTSDFEGNPFIALVYEYMPNGSLENWLHPIPGADTSTNEVRILGLVERLTISMDVACALEYLHHHCHNPIVYCDLKPDNIVFDNNMTAHVADFGLTMFFSDAMSICSSLDMLHQSTAWEVRLLNLVMFTAMGYFF
nr:putative receptor-like protein kinase At3g47110 [Solanum lycopersicum]